MGRGAGKNAGAPPGQSGGGTKSWEQPPAPGREKKRGHLRSVSGQPGRPVHRRPRPEPRRRKVRLPPLPPVGESCARSLAPPLQTEPASLGFGLAAACGGVKRSVSGQPGRPVHRRPRPEPRRRKVRLPPLPPVGESCARSLAPPLQTEPASLGFGLAAACGGVKKSVSGQPALPGHRRPPLGPGRG